MRDDAFERLYEEHAQALFGFLKYRTGDKTVAEELLGDTCERALRARRRFDPRRGSAKTWLYAIALNCLNDHLRRRASESRALERVAIGAGMAASELLEDERLEALGDRTYIEGCLQTLSGPEREVVSLRYGADLSIAEIAKLTGERRATVEGRLYRALRKLRELIGDC